MSIPEDRDVLDELKTLYEELKSYKRLLNLKGRLSDKDRLRETLVRKIGTLKTKVIELTGKEHIQRFGMVYNIWDIGLTAHRISSICDVALDYCIDAVNEAIGKLESDIKEGKRDKAEEIIEKPVKEQSLGKEIRKHLQGTPDELAPHLRRVAEKTTKQGLNYYLRSGDFTYQNTPHYKAFWLLCGKYERLVYFIGEDSEDNDTDKDYAREIGSITIQSLPNNKTLLIAEHISSSFDSDASFYDNFLKNLFSELKELGFVETLPKKLWRVVKELIGIAKVVKP